MESREKTDQVKLNLLGYHLVFASNFWPIVIIGVLCSIFWIELALLISGVLRLIGANASFLETLLVLGIIPIVQNWKFICKSLRLY